MKGKEVLRLCELANSQSLRELPAIVFPRNLFRKQGSHFKSGKISFNWGITLPGTSTHYFLIPTYVM